MNIIEYAKSSQNKGSLLRLAGTVIAIILLFILLHQQGWREIGAAIRQIPAWRFGLALVLMMVSRMAVTCRWHVLLRSAGLNITFSQSTRLTFSGLFASNFLPTTIGGDVVRLAGAIQLKYDGAISAASLVVDRLVGMAGMAMAAPLGIPSFLESKPPEMIQPIASFKYLMSANLIGNSKLVDSIRKLVDKPVNKLLTALSNWRKHPAALAWALVFTWLHMLCLFGSIALLLEGTGDLIPFWLIAGLWSLVYFITLIPISINGYGFQELSMGIIFSTAGGASPQNSLTVAILIRTIMMLVSIPGALFVPGILAAQSRTPTQISQQLD